jgi:hypothetical protein
MIRFLFLFIAFCCITACGSSFSGLSLPQQGIFLVKNGNRVAYMTAECVMTAEAEIEEEEACKPVEALRGNSIRYLQSAPDGSAIAAVVSRPVRPNSHIVNSEIWLHLVGEQAWRRVQTFDNLNEIAFSNESGILALSGTIKTNTDHAGATDNRIVEEHLYLWKEGEFRSLTPGLIGTKSSLTWITRDTLLFESEYGPEEMPSAIYSVNVNTGERTLLLETDGSSYPTLSPTGEQILWSDFQTLYLSDITGNDTTALAMLETQPRAFFWSSTGEKVIVVEIVENNPDWVTQVMQIDVKTMEKELLYRETGLAYGSLVHIEGEDYLFLRELDGFGTLSKIQLLSLSDGTLLDITPEMVGASELPEQIWWHPQP